MKCKPLYVGRQSIGDRFDDGKVFAFFSNRTFSEKEFHRLFPERTLMHLKQIHGNNVVEVNSDSKTSGVEGDALITSEPNVSACVYTADCIPILFHDPSTGKVAACHAGWRGLVKEIILATVAKLESPDPKTIRAWVGPHIRRDSFEVHGDVAETLRTVHRGTSPVVFPHPQDAEKRLVDLTEIGLSQLLHSGISKENVWVHPIDTFASQDFYSYRRDGSTGRLLNFINIIGD